jgi:hypothetical protein
MGAVIGVLAAVVFCAGKAIDFSNVASLPDPTPGYLYDVNHSYMGFGYYGYPGGLVNPHIPAATLENVVSASDDGDDGGTFNVYLKVDAALNLVGAIFMVVAFCLAAIAFLRTSAVERRRLLTAAAGSFALYGAAALAAAFIGATVLSYSYWALPASFTAGAGSALALVVAAVLIRTAVRSGIPSRRVSQGIKAVVLSPISPRLLAWGCGWLAVYFALKAADGVFDLGALRNALSPLPGSLSGGLVTEAAGAVVTAVGAAIAALAFSRWKARRDGMLGVAAIAIALGFLIIAAGLFLQAAYSHDAGDLAEGVSYLVLAVAAGCGAAAFSRQLEQRHGSNFAGLPHPG